MFQEEDVSAAVRRDLQLIVNCNRALDRYSIARLIESAATGYGEHDNE